MTRYSAVMEVRGIDWNPIHSVFQFIVGLSPDLHDFEQIRSIGRPTDVPDTGRVPPHTCIIVIIEIGFKFSGMNKSE